MFLILFSAFLRFKFGSSEFYPILCPMPKIYFEAFDPRVMREGFRSSPLLSLQATFRNRPWI